MTTDNRITDAHVGERLSGYVDGELTQQERQQVEIHCAQCPQCSSELAQLQSVRESIGKARLSDLDQDVWREMMGDTTVKASRTIGWLLLIGGVLAAVGLGVYEIIFESSASVFEKTIVGVIYAGLAGLFISVLRQRLIDRKTDKYKDVEI
jgi:hypothetical protein